MSHHTEHSLIRDTIRTECSSSMKPAKSNKRSEDQIPRPANAFILFRTYITGEWKKRSKETLTGGLAGIDPIYGQEATLSKFAGAEWRALPEHERNRWVIKAERVRDEHKKKYPDYVYRPVHKNARGRDGAEASSSRPRRSKSSKSVTSHPYHPMETPQNASPAYFQPSGYAAYPLAEAPTFLPPGTSTDLSASYPTLSRYDAYNSSISHDYYGQDSSSRALYHPQPASSGVYPAHQNFEIESFGDVEFSAWMTPEASLY